MPRIQIPAFFICPITQQMLLDPVATMDGQIYKKNAIEKWLKEHDTSPSTNLILDNKSLIPMFFLKNQIQEFLKANRVCTLEEFISAVEAGDLAQLDALNSLEHYLDTKLDEYRYAGCNMAYRDVPPYISLQVTAM